MKQLGIDLGTTNTVAVLETEILAIGDGEIGHLPSVVGFMPNESVVTGQAARRRRAIDGANTIFSSKRIIGRRFSASQTREFRARYPFQVVDAGDDRPAFVTRAGQHSPTDIAAILLRRVSEPLGSQIKDMDVVITVPTSFGDGQREATLAAARGAGFTRLRMVDEAEATACAYYVSQQQRGLCAVYDLGGGTFDVSIVECRDEDVRVLSRATEPFLGGDDIDYKIAEWVRREVLKQHNWDLENYSEVAIRLLAESERAKIRLATEEETIVDISQIDPECPIAAEGLPMRRSMMESICMELVQRTFLACDVALADAGVSAAQLDAVLLAGGATHMPVVQQGVEAYFGQTGLIVFEPTSVVALGAALSPFAF
jgi:molecular chaperone DnaK